MIYSGWSYIHYVHELKLSLSSVPTLTALLCSMDSKSLKLRPILIHDLLLVLTSTICYKDLNKWTGANLAKQLPSHVHIGPLPSAHEYTKVCPWHMWALPPPCPQLLLTLFFSVKVLKTRPCLLRAEKEVHSVLTEKVVTQQALATQLTSSSWSNRKYPQFVV